MMVLTDLFILALADASVARRGPPRVASGALHLEWLRGCGGAQFLPETDGVSGPAAVGRDRDRSGS